MANSGPLDNLIPFNPHHPQPVTPQPPHATIDGVEPGDSKSQIDISATNMTPPPSTQVDTARPKDRTPTPTYSSISTPPPTIDAAIAHQDKLGTAMAASMSAEQIANAPSEELRRAVVDLQAAYQEVKMNAAHYKLQYQMLVQESEAAIERMDVEARMAQHENDVIHIAGQARATVTPSIPGQDGMILVQKDLYQYMCLEIQQLHKTTDTLQKENIKQDRLITQQEGEIETLSDRVALLRDRIRSNREHLNHLRRPVAVPGSEMPSSTYTTPKRAGNTGQDQFAALLQASEIARKEVNPARKSSHSKKANNAYQNVTMTPQRYQNPPTVYATPSHATTTTTPATAPVPRVDNFRPHDSYAPAAKQSAVRRPPAPRSEDTVSNSDRDVDSEAETDIIEPDGPVSESQASIKASLMLRSSHEGDLGERMGAARSSKPKPQPKQTTLFGAVRKHGIDRNDDSERPTKKGRTGIGLGIMGARS